MKVDNSRKKIDSCCIYTIAIVDGIDLSNENYFIQYRYNLGDKLIRACKKKVAIGIDRSWLVDVIKVNRGRLLLQSYCNDIEVHRILWDISIPDTLMQVPQRGWVKKPLWLR